MAWSWLTGDKDAEKEVRTLKRSETYNTLGPPEFR